MSGGYVLRYNLQRPPSDLIRFEKLYPRSSQCLTQRRSLSRLPAIRFFIAP